MTDSMPPPLPNSIRNQKVQAQATWAVTLVLFGINILTLRTRLDLMTAVVRAVFEFAVVSVAFGFAILLLVRASRKPVPGVRGHALAGVLLNGAVLIVAGVLAVILFSDYRARQTQAATAARAAATVAAEQSAAERARAAELAAKLTAEHARNLAEAGRLPSLDSLSDPSAISGPGWEGLVLKNDGHGGYIAIARLSSLSTRHALHPVLKEHFPKAQAMVFWTSADHRWQGEPADARLGILLPEGPGKSRQVPTLELLSGAASNGEAWKLAFQMHYADKPYHGQAVLVLIPYDVDLRKGNVTMMNRADCISFFGKWYDRDRPAAELGTPISSSVVR